MSPLLDGDPVSASFPAPAGGLSRYCARLRDSRPGLDRGNESAELSGRFYCGAKTGGSAFLITVLVKSGYFPSTLLVMKCQYEARPPVVNVSLMEKFVASLHRYLCVLWQQSSALVCSNISLEHGINLLFQSRERGPARPVLPGRGSSLALLNI